MKRKKVVLLVFGVVLTVAVIGCSAKNTVNKVPAVSSEPVIETESQNESNETETIEEIQAETEHEGGDGEETTETVAEVPTEEITDNGVSTQPQVTDCDPVTRYTNTNANIRAQGTKDSDLVDSVSINTGVLQTGTTQDGWSRIEHNGLVCFIKSSLLSDTKTEVKKPTTNNQANSGSSNGNNQSNTGSSANNSNQSNNNQSNNDQANNSGGGNAGEPDLGDRGNRGQGGSGGYGGGSTGGTMDNMGGAN